MVSSWVVGAVVLLLTYALVRWFPSSYSTWRRTINKIPGPAGLPVIGNAHQVAFVSNKRRGELVTQWARQYGGIFRLWLGSMPTVAVLDPVIAGELLRTTKHLTKGASYRFLFEWLGTGLLTSTGDKWRVRRRMITPTFHFDVLRTYSEEFREQTAVLVQLLRKHADDGKNFDVFPYITRCALDIICNTAMGQSVNAQADPDNAYVKAVFALTRQTFERALRPWEWNDYIFKNLLPNGRAWASHINTLKTFGRAVIQRRRRELGERQGEADGTSGDTKRRHAFLDMLLHAVDDNGQPLSDEDVLEEVETFMFEGHDTTSAGVAWALYHIGQHADVRAKIHEELDRVMGSRSVPTPENVNDLEYLEMCVKESLRLHPSVPVIARIAEEDTTLGGYMVPKGTEIGILIIGIHRRDKDWGADVNDYKPERFLPENSAGRDPYAFVPFSAGSRNCVGQRFAILEEKTMLAGILKNFDVETDTSIDPDMQAELILRPGNGINIKLRARKI